jgi:hypothetical protein
MNTRRLREISTRSVDTHRNFTCLHTVSWYDVALNESEANLKTIQITDCVRKFIMYSEGLLIEWPSNWGSIPAGAGDFYLLHRVRVGTGAHFLCSTCQRLFPWGKAGL